MRDAQYKGPDAVDYSQEANKIKDQSQRLDLTKTESGRNTLLEDTYKRPDYTRGGKLLDQVLLQNNPNTRQSFKDLREKYSGISDWLQGRKDQDLDAIQNAKDITSQTRIDAKNAIDSSISDFKKGLDDRAANYDAEGLYNNAIIDAQDNIVSRELFDKIGLEQGQQLYGVDLRDYINNPGYDPTGKDLA